MITLPALFRSSAFLVLSALATAPLLPAQLVGEDNPAPPQQLSNPPQPQPAQTNVPAAPSTKKLRSKDFTLEGGKVWTDTGLSIEPGQRVIIAAQGKLRYADAREDNGPEGLNRGFKDLLRILPFNEAGRGAVLGRIGDPETAEPFLVGSRKEAASPVGGKFFLGINQATNDTGSGSYKVTVEIYAADAAAAHREVARRVSSLPGIDNDLFRKIPRRISDKEGNPGDMVNFLILGTEEQMRQVFTSAGWVKVDADVRNTLLHGILESISKESYLTMPMSQLYLFDRPQDYGWAHAEPIQVVRSRNHLRVWKAPFGVGGRMLWVGAATHDIGFERDQRNNGITHKIDPDIDLERDYVEKTLSATGLVAQVAHFQPDNPLKEARTATGGSFHSNGEVLVLALGAAPPDLSAKFASTFCSVLQGENPDGGSWGSCASYLHSSPDAAALQPAALSSALPPLDTSLRVLVVPGVLSSCQQKNEAFALGQSHLREKHGMTVDFLQTPNESSESNGRLIADYLHNAARADSRKFILVSYSKGSPDVQEALAADPSLRSLVAGHVTISGAVGGSPIAETMPAVAERYASALKLGTCQGNLAEAFKSLRQDVRRRFLRDHPDPLVPSFSLVAVSDATSTSKMLLQSWRLLTAIDPHTDGQLLQDDAVIPGSSSFGVLRADHLAVALDYGSVASSGNADDANRYPRAALFEAAVRAAIASLPH